MASLLAASAPPAPAAAPAPPPPTATTPEPTTTAADDDDPDGDDDDRDVGVSVSDEYLEVVSDDILGTRETASACVLGLLTLILELNMPWVHGDSNTSKGEAAALKGSVWAVALRKHGNESCGHYYSHVAFAHLKELIVEHGHLQSGNDEVLEKGNRDMKRFRDMTYWGGDSSKESQATKKTNTCYRVVTEANDGAEAVYETYFLLFFACALFRG